MSFKSRQKINEADEKRKNLENEAMKKQLKEVNEAFDSMDQSIFEDEDNLDSPEKIKDVDILKKDGTLLRTVKPGEIVKTLISLIETYTEFKLKYNWE